jgi:uncharacterized membrane protein YidH (DUF202 family)
MIHFLLLVLLLLLPGCGGGGDEVSIEERLYLSLRHDPARTLPAGREAVLGVETSGNVVLSPGSVSLYSASPGDTGWARQELFFGDEPGLLIGSLPTGRRGSVDAYFFLARTPSGKVLTLPEGLDAGEEPYRVRRSGNVPGLLSTLMWLGMILTTLCLAGAGFSAWLALQRRTEPGAGEQTRLAQWVAAGTVLLILSAGLLGALHSWISWGAPYRGFPFGPSALHNKVVVLMAFWGTLSWAAWGSLTRRQGARDRFAPRLYATLILVAVVASVLILLLPESEPLPGIPPLPPLAG